ncbi:bifunctional DNA-formamidopyrimidine glycosylase/DNA-(apurinic or apyrimidinic site) lyase [bacterium]|nr:bifunctional DNA-formamidopyrimidine glycosylase/DNA-(apurinic or apyrimidinic site) lyase [bacterium]
MPELPEVETIRRSLQPLLVGRAVKTILVRETRLRRPVNVRQLRKWIQGHTITALNRRGKYLLWQMDNGSRLLIHLGMSGRLGYCAGPEELEPHTHLCLGLDNGAQVRYRDPRRFGCVQAVAPNERCGLLQGLGPEPLSADFTADYLYDALHGSRRPVKAALMDSRMVVGVGNIYANEALFHCGIAPQRPAGTLSHEQWERVIESVIRVLQRAIRKGGTTLNDFRNGLGEPGFFQTDLSVYDQEDQPCQRCGRPICRVVLQGRSTYYCPACQK